MAFSLSCFIGIICTLMVYDQKPAPGFSYGITLNAIISLLSTASKSSLIFVIAECIGQLKCIWFYKGQKRKKLDGMQLFNSASRGPLGSLTMIWQHKGRSLVSLGALITVLAFAFDPFIQQILTYPMRNTVEATNSSSAAAKQAVTLFLGPLEEEWERIIYSAQWSDNFDVDPSCPSGNCTWPAFRSVGMCSECEDITDSTTFECHPFEFDSSDRPVSQTVICEVIPRQGHSTNITITITIWEGDGGFDMYMPQEIAWDPSEIKGFFYPGNVTDGVLQFLRLTRLRFVLAYAELAYTNSSRPTGFPPRDLGRILKIGKATQCTLTPCARTYYVSVVDGTPSIDTSTPEYGDIFFMNRSTGVGLTRPPKLEAGMDPPTWEICWKPGSGPPVNLTKLADGIWANTSKLAFCSYDDNYTGLATYLTGEAVSRIWVRTDSGWSQPLLVSRDARIAKMRTDGLEKVMSDVAASFTKAALTTSNHTVYGTIFRAEVYVSVNWIWILLPAALVVLSVCFLILTIHANRRSRLHLWKTSILAVLYHGLDDFGSGDDGAQYETVSQMQRTAENVQVRLKRVDDQRGLVLDQS